MSACENPPHAQTHPRNTRAAGEMMSAAFCFATMACIAHGLRGELAWPVVAFARIFVTFVLVAAGLAYFRVPLAIRGTRALWARSLFGSTGLLCTFYSVTHLPITDAVTIFSTGPVWVTVILVAVFRRPLPKQVWFHALLALAGVYVMHRPSFDAQALPLLVALGGAMAAAAAKVSISRCKDLRNLTVVTHYAACASVVSLGMCVVAADRVVLNPEMSPSVWFWLLPMGLFGTAAQVLLTAAFRRGSPAMVALVGISQIGFSATYDLVLWDYHWDAWKVAGVAMIALAIAMSVLASPRAGTGEVTPE